MQSPFYAQQCAPPSEVVGSQLCLHGRCGIPHLPHGLGEPFFRHVELVTPVRTHSFSPAIAKRCTGAVRLKERSARLLIIFRNLRAPCQPALARNAEAVTGLAWRASAPSAP